MPQTDIRCEPLKTKLLKLQNSKEYRAAFSKLKEEILTKDEDKSSSKIDSINVAKKIAEKYKEKGFSKYDLSVIEKEFLFDIEDKRTQDRRRSSFFRFSQDMMGSHCKYIPLEQVKKILLKENINKHKILIPEVYSDFKNRWRLICFFDPDKPFTIGFDPFFREPQAMSWVGIPNDDQPYILDLRCDITLPLSLLLRRFEEEIRFIKSVHKFRERRTGRYSEEEVSEVRKLMDGRNLMEVFKILNPQHKKFNYLLNYIVNPSPTHKEREAVRLYKRVQRIGGTVKKGNKTD